MDIAYAAQEVAEEASSGGAFDIGRMVEYILGKIPLWIGAAILIFATFILAKVARKIVENKLADSGIEEDHQELQILGGRMVYISIVTVGVTSGLKMAGIDLTTIISAVAFGVGFALKDIMMNFIAGIMILISRNFTIGDFIDVGGTLGKVIEIQSRVTILQATNGTKVIVPNADMFKNKITSFTSNPFRKIDLSITVDYKNNIENVLRVCMDTMKHTEGILLTPKPSVLISEFGDNGIVVKMKAWVDSKGGWVRIKGNLSLNIKNAFIKHGIVIPYPIMTIVNDKDRAISEKIMQDATPKPAPAIAQDPGLQAQATGLPLAPIAER